jgi:anti-sigma regulatory factor (Ser/Thr protein kinase)
MSVGCTDRPGELEHCALLYRDRDEWARGVISFIAPGLRAGEPVIAAVPADRQELLRCRLDASSQAVKLVDMRELGRNPARIIPFIRQQADHHPGRRVHYVGEPIWPGRSSDEIAEATLHESLINRAFQGRLLRVLCPYDASQPDPQVLDGVHQTHPHVADTTGSWVSRQYMPDRALRQWRQPLRSPRPDAIRLRFQVADLARARTLVAQQAKAAGLDSERREDLTLAVNELATNSIRHATGTGELRIWRENDRIICEVKDSGYITDPLIGRTVPDSQALDSHGLWLVNQLCDLVQIRSSPAGTTVRVQMTTAPARLIVNKR